MNQKTEIISNRQFFSLFSMFLLGGNLLVASNSIAGRDAWIAFFLAGVLMFGFLLLLLRLYMLNPGLGLYKITEKNLGKVCAVIIGALFLLMAMLLASFTVANFVNFTKTSSFPHAPRFLIILILLIPAFLIVRHGTEVIARWTAIVYPIMLLMIVFTLIFSFGKMDITLLQPILYDGFGPVLVGAVRYIAFPLSTFVVILMLFQNVKEGGKKLFKSATAGYVVSFSIILLTILRNIVTLGYPTSTHLYYPSYMAVELVNAGDFFQRLEFLVAMSYLLNDFISTVIFFLFISKGIAYVFRISDYRKVVWIPAAVTFFVCQFWLNNVLRSLTVFRILPFITIPISLGIPIILYLVSEIKNIRKKKQQVKKT